MWLWYLQDFVQMVLPYICSAGIKSDFGAVHGSHADLLGSAHAGGRYTAFLLYLFPCPLELLVVFFRFGELLQRG